jgi:predicted AAA+ superfamily ATPase
MIERKESGSLKAHPIPDKFLEGVDYRRVSRLLSQSEDERIAEAVKIISETINNKQNFKWLFSFAVDQSVSLIPGYATLDANHRLQIKHLMSRIANYLRDKTKKRPFNALMIASPGAGKSHFIKQLALAMTEESVGAVTFNMATMQSLDDIARSLDQSRNLKVNDKYPILFLDEFDSDPQNYAALLPLLWDGELQVGHRDLKLGKAVIILAGSKPEVRSLAMTAGVTSPKKRETKRETISSLIYYRA